MRWSHLKLRLRALRSRERAEGELDEELRFHIEMETRKLQAAGMTDGEARRRARVEFGGVDRVTEECRDVRGLTLLESLARDVRYGARMLRKSPVFTVVAVLSLAIGIGANTAVFSLVNAVLLRTLPVRNPEQLVVLKWGAHRIPNLYFTFSTGGKDSHGRDTRNSFSWPIFEQMRRQARTVEDVIGFFPLAQLNVAAGGQALVTGGQAVSGNYFPALGVGALIGRPISADDETAGGAPVAVISYRFWERVFGLSADVIGKTLVVNGQPCVIVGVTPKSFYGVSLGGFSRAPQIDVTVPIRARARFEATRRENPEIFGPGDFWVQMIARRVVGTSDAAIEAELAAAVAANLPEAARRELTGEPPYGSVEPGGQGVGDIRRNYRDPLLIVTAVVGLTLLLACANLAGLLLARAAARQKELMIRLALGARRARLLRQLLVEGALLSAAGAAAGLAVAYGGVRALLASMASGRSPVMIEVSPDARVLAFTIAAALLTTFLFALAPALRATRVDVSHGLKADTPVGGSGRFTAVRALVAAQIAVALLLGAGAILLERTLANLRSVPLGFNADNLVVFDIAPGRNGYDQTRALQLYARVLERLKQTPGVVSATVSGQRLMSGWVSSGGVRLDGAEDEVDAFFNFVGPEFFETMQIPMAAGRGIGPRDMAAAPRVAVVNEAFARKYLGGASPIGHRFRWGKDLDVEIIGEARDARYQRVRGDVPLTIYAPYPQRPWGWPDQMAVEVRAAGDLGAAVAAIRRTMAETDRMLPLIDFRTQKAQIETVLGQERLFAWLVSLFGAIALALACIGLYGLVASSVTGRTREIGVRMALGAGRAAVLRMLLGEIAMTAGAGAGIGLLAAWASTRVIESMLFGIEPHDPATFALGAAAMMLIALAAALLPACRALRIDPVRALRYE